MSDTHEVISAFLDDEPFDPTALGEALSDPAGRALLIDLVALRHLVQPDERIVAQPRERQSAWRPYLAAAAVLVALVGGYLMGERRVATGASDPPAPTRVVQAAEWQVPEGGGR